jgi:hypothetical protein
MEDIGSYFNRCSLPWDIVQNQAWLGSLRCCAPLLAYSRSRRPHSFIAKYDGHFSQHSSTHPFPLICTLYIIGSNSRCIPQVLALLKELFKRRDRAIASPSSTSLSTMSSPPITPFELSQPQAVFICHFAGCNTVHPVNKDILLQHLLAAHNYQYQRGVQVACLWAGCICAGRAYRVGRCPEGPHPSHVEDLTEHIWDRHLHFRWVCPTCDRADWADRASLVRHMQTKPCPGRAAVRCVKCYQAFASEHLLAVHNAQCQAQG